MNTKLHLLSFFSSFLESNKECSIDQTRTNWMSRSNQDKLHILLGESKRRKPLIRVPTAYVIFSKEMRLQVKTEHKNDPYWTSKMTTVEVRKRWERIGREELKTYIDRERQVKIEYDKQNISERRESSNAPIKEIHNCPERRRRRIMQCTGYHLFSKSIRDSVKEANPGIDSVSLSGKILHIWTCMTDRGQQEWKRKAI